MSGHPHDVATADWTVQGCAAVVEADRRQGVAERSEDLVGIAQPGEAGELPINVGEVHVAILKQMILDITHLNFYNKVSFSIEEAA
jgi:hypothetical protein